MKENSGGPENPNFGKPAIDWPEVDHISKMTSLTEAKKYALLILETSSANSKNKLHIASIVNKAKSLKGLTLSLSNICLAHPRENLKII